MYVITGATGHTGSTAAFHLLAEGKKVRGIGRSADRLQRLVQMGGEAFVADLTDSEALTRAFRGAEAVYVMIPPDVAATNLLERQRVLTESIASALEHAQVPYAVTLSSIGADKVDGTGPVVGLHRMEERLNKISGLNVFHLRCGYFMENFLAQTESIHETGKLFGALDPQLRLPLVATRDIGDAAAQVLLRLTFTGHQSRELQCNEDLNMNEVAAVIGHEIGKPDLKYVRASNDQLRSSLMLMGMSEDFANQLLQMSAAMNSGHMRPLEPRGEHNTTPTTFLKFVQQEFVPRFRRTVAA